MEATAQQASTRKAMVVIAAGAVVVLAGLQLAERVQQHGEAWTGGARAEAARLCAGMVPLYVHGSDVQVGSASSSQVYGPVLTLAGPVDFVAPDGLGRQWTWHCTTSRSGGTVHYVDTVVGP